MLLVNNLLKLFNHASSHGVQKQTPRLMSMYIFGGNFSHYRKQTTHNRCHTPPFGSETNRFKEEQANGVICRTCRKSRYYAETIGKQRSTWVGEFAFSAKNKSHCQLPSTHKERGKPMEAICLFAADQKKTQNVDTQR